MGAPKKITTAAFGERVERVAALEAHNGKHCRRCIEQARRERQLAASRERCAEMRREAAERERAEQERRESLEAAARAALDAAGETIRIKPSGQESDPVLGRSPGRSWRPWNTRIRAWAVDANFVNGPSRVEVPTVDVRRELDDGASEFRTALLAGVIELEPVGEDAT